MPSQNRRTPRIANWIISAVLIAAAFLIWQSKQSIVDAVQYYQYTPGADISTLTREAGLTDNAKFTFYATHPAIETSTKFNQNCDRKEADSPVLGCYRADRIFIYDVTDSRLNGIQSVTAAHELLHAEYERMTKSEQDELRPLLQAAYDSNKTPDLVKRMQYYEKSEPGQAFNELHSIAGTEFKRLDPKLEAHYKKYFNDRSSLASLYQKVDAVFSRLSNEADTLLNQINALVADINSSTNGYNQRSRQLSLEVQSFNQQARQSGGFSTQDEFEAKRSELLQKSNQLSNDRQAIQEKITTYKTLVSRLDSINAESASLSRSIDSNLSSVPTL